MTVPTPPPAAPLTFAQAAKAMAATKTGAQVGRFIRLFVAAFVALIAPKLLQGQTVNWTWAALSPLLLAALETAYRQFKAPASV